MESQGPIAQLTASVVHTYIHTNHLTTQLIYVNVAFSLQIKYQKPLQGPVIINLGVQYQVPNVIMLFFCFEISPPPSHF